MKKKVIKTLVCAVVAVIVVLLLPVPVMLKDGGSIVFKSLTYTVYKKHSLNIAVLDADYVENRYLVGYTVEIFGKKVFDNSHTIIECDKFSFEEVCSYYEHETVGVKRDGFVNTEKTEIKNAEWAVELAKKECKTEYNSISVGYDKKQKVYRVSFSTPDVDGGNVEVYIDSYGVTRLVVAGE